MHGISIWHGSFNFSLEAMQSSILDSSTSKRWWERRRKICIHVSWAYSTYAFFLISFSGWFFICLFACLPPVPFQTLWDKLSLTWQMMVVHGMQPRLWSLRTPRFTNAAPRVVLLHHATGASSYYGYSSFQSTTWICVVYIQLWWYS